MENSIKMHKFDKRKFQIRVDDYNFDLGFHRPVSTEALILFFR